jgi:hypothetical protein
MAKVDNLYANIGVYFGIFFIIAYAGNLYIV